MKQCECGSYALNIDPDSRRCDVCYYKHKVELLEQATISTPMKAVCMGEFAIVHRPDPYCERCGGSGEYGFDIATVEGGRGDCDCERKETIPWTTMKDIYKMMHNVRVGKWKEKENRRLSKARRKL